MWRIFWLGPLWIFQDRDDIFSDEMSDDLTGAPKEARWAQARPGPEWPKLVPFDERLKITDMNDVCLKCTDFTKECCFQMCSAIYSNSHFFSSSHMKRWRNCEKPRRSWAEKCKCGAHFLPRLGQKDMLKEPNKIHGEAAICWESWWANSVRTKVFI